MNVFGMLLGTCWLIAGCDWLAATVRRQRCEEAGSEVPSTCRLAIRFEVGGWGLVLAAAIIGLVLVAKLIAGAAP